VLLRGFDNVVISFYNQSSFITASMESYSLYLKSQMPKILKKRMGYY